MAAIAISKPTEAKKIYRANAPETEGVRLDNKEYSTWSTQEQMDIFSLQEEIIQLWETNRSMAEKQTSMKDDEIKLKSMNDEMQEFFSKIPQGNLSTTVGTQTDIEENDPNIWKEKERRLQYEVIQQQKEVIENIKSKQTVVPMGLTEVIKKIILEIFSTIIQILYHSLLPKTIAPNGQKSLPEAPT